MTSKHIIDKKPSPLCNIPDVLLPLFTVMEVADTHRAEQLTALTPFGILTKPHPHTVSMIPFSVIQLHGRHAEKTSCC